MKVGSQLEEAQFEQIDTAGEAAAGKESGRAYWNTDKTSLLVGDGANLIEFKSVQGTLGDIRTSMLTEALFQSENDTTWIIADGQDVTGSDYHTLTGETTIPDTRGTFLRGKNNGRVDGKQNPDGDLPLGTYQVDDFFSHDHSVSSSSFTGGGAQAAIASNNVGYPAHITGMTGGNETRPRNITVNIFIKINR
jgi:hypothetical protein